METRAEILRLGESENWRAQSLQCKHPSPRVRRRYRSRTAHVGPLPQGERGTAAAARRKLVQGILSLAVWICLHAWAEEDQFVPAPPRPDKTKPAAQTYWDYAEPTQYDVIHTDSSETKLAGQRIDYKGRGNSDLRFRVTLRNAAGDTQRLAATVVTLAGKARDANGAQTEYSLDSGSFVELVSGRTVYDVRVDGTQRQREQFRTAQQQPWTVSQWSNEGWQEENTAAAGMFVPLADSLSLGRQLALLLPALQSAPLSEGQVYELNTDIPFCAPVVNAPKLHGAYRIEKKGDGKADIVVGAEADDTNRRNVQWGGIPLSGVNARAKLKGRLSIDTETHTLLAAEIEWEQTFSSARDDFSSTSRGKSIWKAK